MTTYKIVFKVTEKLFGKTLFMSDDIVNAPSYYEATKLVEGLVLANNPNTDVYIQGGWKIQPEPVTTDNLLERMKPEISRDLVDTFHPDDSQEVDYDTQFDDDFIKDREPKTPCTHEETHSVNGWDRCFDCGVVLDKFGYIKEQFHEHFESLNDDIMTIVRNQFSKHDQDQWRKMSATNYLNAELLKTLSKDQLIDIIIQTEFTVDSFGDEIQQEDK